MKYKVRFYNNRTSFSGEMSAENLMTAIALNIDFSFEIKPVDGGKQLNKNYLFNAVELDNTVKKDMLLSDSMASIVVRNFQIFKELHLELLPIVDDKTFADMMDNRILEAVNRYGSQARAARSLGMSQRAIHYKLRKLADEGRYKMPRDD